MISLGIYKDNSSVLYPLYGTSDISQGFCRTAAVYESIYVLNSDIAEPGLEASEGVVLGDQTLSTQYAFVSAKHYEAFPSETHVTGEIVRCVIVSHKLLWTGYDGPVMLSLPPGSIGNELPTYIYQVQS